MTFSNEANSIAVSWLLVSLYKHKVRNKRSCNRIKIDYPATVVPLDDRAFGWLLKIYHDSIMQQQYCKRTEKRFI